MGVEVAVGCALVFGAILAGVWAFRHRERRAAEAHAKAATEWDAAGAEAVAIAADTPILRRSLVRADWPAWWPWGASCCRKLRPTRR